MKTIKKLIVMVLILAMSLTMFAVSVNATGSIAYGAATVTASALNIRSGPGTSYSIVGSVKRSNIVVILECTSNSWYRINYQGKEGYVSTEYLKDVLKAENFEATGKVTGSDCRMRSKPSTSSSVLGTYNSGIKMNVIGINNGWYKVKYDGKTGYMRSDLMTIVGASSSSSNAPVTEEKTEIGIVKGYGCRMRSEPNTSSKILGTYNAGTRMTVLGSENGWYKIKYDGKTGYMRSDLMEIGTGSSNSGNSSNTSLREKIVNFALKYKGYNYVYGGESLSEGGFDCSGLVYYVFKSNFGYSIHRTASTQYKYDGRSISKSELQPGDLVFFSSNGSSVTHVGIYIGGGEFIHASTSKTGVIISSLNSSYYTRVYWGAKNIID